MPFYPYCRGDKKDDARTPISSRAIADILDVDRIVTIELHSAQQQGFFGKLRPIPVDNIYATPIMLGDICKKHFNDPVVVSYMLKRCGAVYIFASAITRDTSIDKAEVMGSISNEAILNAGMILIEKLNWSEEEASNSLRTDVTNMVEYYKKDGSDFFARTGLYMQDNYIGDDVFICGKLMEKFR
mgnify:CR=1 FL=1